MVRELDEVQLYFMTEKERQQYEKELRLDKAREEFVDGIEKFKNASNLEYKTKLTPIPYVEDKSFEPYEKITANVVNIEKVRIANAPEILYEPKDVSVSLDVPERVQSVPFRNLDSVDSTVNNLPEHKRPVSPAESISARPMSIEDIEKIGLPKLNMIEECIRPDFKIEGNAVELPDVPAISDVEFEYNNPEKRNVELPEIFIVNECVRPDFKVEKNAVELPKFSTITDIECDYRNPEKQDINLPEVVISDSFTEKVEINPKYCIKGVEVDLEPIEKNVDFDEINNIELPRVDTPVISKESVEISEFIVQDMPEIKNVNLNIKEVSIIEPQCYIEHNGFNIPSFNTEVSFDAFTKQELPDINVGMIDCDKINTDWNTEFENVNLVIPEKIEMVYIQKEHKINELPKNTIDKAPVIDINDILSKI